MRACYYSQDTLRRYPMSYFIWMIVYTRNYLQTLPRDPREGSPEVYRANSMAL